MFVKSIQNFPEIQADTNGQPAGNYRSNNLHLQGMQTVIGKVKVFL